MKNFVFLYKWLFPILLAVGLILAVRQWFVASYRISTGAMEEALHKGDFVLVNKMTIEGNPGRNRIVLFSSPLSRDSVSSPLFISRCLGMPGDTVWVDNEGYTLNGRRMPLAPLSLQTWLINTQWKEQCLKAIQASSVPLREWTQLEDGYTLRLTPMEAARINEEITDSEGQLQLCTPNTPYRIILPKKGYAYRLDEYSLPLCKDAILRETGGKAKFRDNKLYIDGKETVFFFFQQDYYWLLSDNPEEAVDSRFLGVIPADHLIGNVWFCWFSKDKNRIFTRIY